MSWIQRHVTGTPADNEAADLAQEALERYVGDEYPEDLNAAAWEAERKLPPPRRNGWV